MTLSATLTVPPGPGPHPGAVLVGGFGPSNRDGVFGDRAGGTYREIALGLARRGVAVLRYDKRGIGESDGPALSWLDARPLAADAGGGGAGLVAMPGIDSAHVALIGHSQGGDLALEAARRAPVARVVTLSAPGGPLGLLPRVSGTAAACCAAWWAPRSRAPPCAATRAPTRPRATARRCSCRGRATAPSRSPTWR